MFDVSTLALEVDARPVAKATAALKEFTAESSKAEAASKKLTATQRAGLTGAMGAGMRRLATDQILAVGAVKQAQLAADRAVERSGAQVLAFRMRMAKQQAGEEGAAARAAAAATAQADREAERSADAVYRLRTRLTRQRATEEAAAARAAAAAEAELARSAAALKASYDPLGATIDRVNSELAEADRLAKAGAISATDLANAQRALGGRLEGLQGLHAKSAAGARLQAHEVTNLGYQIQDIAVQLAQKGSNPFLVMLQQGTQIGAIFQTAGKGVKAFALAAASSIASMLPMLGVIGAVGLAVDLLLKKFTEASERSKKLAAGVHDLTKELAASVPSLSASADAANLASEGARNFEGWLQRGSASLAGYAERLKTATVNQYLFAAAQASATAKELKDRNTRVNGRGVTVYTGLDGSTGLERYKALQAEADANVQLAQARALAAIKAPTSAFTAEQAASHRAVAAATSTQTKATDDLAVALQQVLQSLETPMETALRETREKMATLRKALDAGKLGAVGYREAIDRLNPTVVDAKDAQKAWNPEIERAATEIPKLGGAVKSLEEHFRDLGDAFDDVSYSFGGILRSFKTGNFGRLIDDVMALKNGLGQLLASGAGGALSAGSAVATAIGGKGGRAIGGGLGLAGAGVSLGAFAGSAAGAAALGTAGLGAIVPMLASFAGPIGLAAGALYAAAKLLNVGGKPSNAGAGYDLRTGAVTGGKRTSETEGAATSAGRAIQAIEDALKAAGIGLKDAVTGLVIGTRDATQIYLQSGKTLTSAVGDSGAAVDTAMRALLSGAAYVSDAQRQLVDSALAAGKGFDDISAILGAYEAAQKVGASLADQILQMTNPSAYDTEAVRREIAEQRKAYAALTDQGYLTAAQLSDLNTQLATLEGLRLADVVKRYATDTAAETGSDALEKARSTLLDAYEREAGAKKAEIDAMRQAAAGLQAFRRELDYGAIAGRDPVSQYMATRREFDRLSSLEASNPERVASLQGVAQAFLEASRVASPTQLAFDRDLQAVRRATEASQTATSSAADLAQSQLDAMTAQVGLLVQLNAGVVSVAQAIANLKLLTASQPVNDNSVDVGRYLALNPDLAANWNAGGSLRGAGATLEAAARAHYATTGRMEISQGLRGYAAGGDHPGGLRLVGENGPELEVTGPSRIYSAPETRRMLGDNSDVVAELRAVRQELEGTRAELREIRRETKGVSSEIRSMQLTGVYARGEAPDEPVKTVAA